MTTTPIDFNQPDAAATVGGELVTARESLVSRLAPAPILDQAGLAQAVADRQTIAEFAKRVEAYFGPLINLSHKLHKALCDRKRQILDPLERLDTAKRVGISAYKAALDRAREALERELAEQAHRDEQDRAAQQAASYERRGDHQMAKAVLEEAIAAPAPVVVLVDETKAVEGLKFRRRYAWRYAGGPEELERTPPAVVARTMQLIPREYLTIDPKKLASLARDSKATAKVPGIEFYHVDDPIR